MLQDTRRFFLAEIRNEEGDQPATLRTALESVRSGYEPFEGFRSTVVLKEIGKLIEEYGESCLLETFLDTLYNE